MNNQYERLGAVGVFQVDLPAQGMRYRFAIFENPYALPAVAIPPEIWPDYPRVRPGAAARAAMPGNSVR